MAIVKYYVYDFFFLIINVCFKDILMYNIFISISPNDENQLIHAQPIIAFN